jgi:hypothetical protein
MRMTAIAARPAPEAGAKIESREAGRKGASTMTANTSARRSGVAGLL